MAVRIVSECVSSPWGFGAPRDGRRSCAAASNGILTGFHADLVEDKVIVEIKALESIAPVHKEPLLTYLKLADKRLGLLNNCNVTLIKDDITRIVNGLNE